MKGAIWTLWAQGASSLSNLLLAVFIARQSNVEQFAGFALVIPLYVVVQRVIRVQILIPRQISLNNGSETSQQNSLTSAASCALLGLTFSIPTAFASLFIPENYGDWLLTLAIGLPALSAYDSIRYEYLSKRTPNRTAAIDTVWLLLQTSASLIITAAGISPIAHLVAWILPPALIVAVFAGSSSFRTKRAPLGSALAMIKESRVNLADMLSDLWSSVLVVQGIPYAIAALLEAVEAAAFRAAQTLLGPMNTVVMGLQPTLQIAVAKRSSNIRSALGATAIFATFITLLSGIYAFSLSVLPDHVGVELLGDTWHNTQPLLAGLGALLVARSPFFAITTALRSLRRLRMVAALRYIASTGLLASACLAAGFGTINAVAWAMAGTSAVMSLISIALLMRIAQTESNGGTNDNEREAT